MEVDSCDRLLVVLVAEVQVDNSSVSKGLEVAHNTAYHNVDVQQVGVEGVRLLDAPLVDCSWVEAVDG